MKVVNQIRAPFGMADLSDEIQLVKISHLSRTDFELCILDLFNMLMCAIDMDMWNLHELDMHPMCSLDLTERVNKDTMVYGIYSNCRIPPNHKRTTT